MLPCMDNPLLYSSNAQHGTGYRSSLNKLRPCAYDSEN